MHRKIPFLPRPFSGFATDKAKKGEQVQVKVRLGITSLDPQFRHYVGQIHKLFLSEIHPDPAQFTRFLVLIHKDHSVDIYTNDFQESTNVKVNKDLKKGSAVFEEDVAEYNFVDFPGIEIKEDDSIIYFSRIGWDFILFYDTTAQTNEKHNYEYKRAIAQLKSELSLSRIADSIKSATETAGEHEMIILTEGKTDQSHIAAAIRKLGLKAKVRFAPQDNGTYGDANVIRMCATLAMIPQKHKVVFIFDRDNSDVLSQLDMKRRPHGEFEIWGNNVYSMAIPCPPHRKPIDDIAIEHYYLDHDLEVTDSKGRRLYFDHELKWDNSLGHFVVLAAPTSPSGNGKIFSGKCELVKDVSGNQLCISKARFAENIENCVDGYDTLDHSHFSLILSELETIYSL